MAVIFNLFTDPKNLAVLFTTLVLIAIPVFIGIYIAIQSSKRQK